MTPWDQLAEALPSTLPTGVSVYDSPTPQLVPPAVVIRPDNPWVETPSRGDGGGFCFDRQRYVAVAVVTASTPSSGLRKLYAILWGIRQTLDALAGWEWISMGAPVIDESTGSAYLAAPVRLTYRNSTEPQEES